MCCADGRDEWDPSSEASAGRERPLRKRPSRAQTGLAERSLLGLFLTGRPRVPGGSLRCPPPASEAPCGALQFPGSRRVPRSRRDLDRHAGMLPDLSPEGAARGLKGLLDAADHLERLLHADPENSPVKR